MRARITVTIGAVRIFPDGTPVQVFGGQVRYPPHTVELDGTWAVGSGSSPLAGQTPGTFRVEALEAGVLRVFTEARDGKGNVVPSVDSKQLEMKAGDKASFNCHESNAATVSSQPPLDLGMLPGSHGGNQTRPRRPGARGGPS